MASDPERIAAKDRKIAELETTIRHLSENQNLLSSEVERLRAALPTETQRDYLYGLVIRDAGIRGVDAPHYKAILDWIKALPVAQTSPAESDDA